MPSLVRFVAVPLGNPLDLSPRARAALEEAEIIFCEDTRKTRDLAERAGFALAGKLVAMPGDRETNADFASFAGETSRWAFCSDAGTPVVNDPGRALLLWCRANGIATEAVPGPSAPVLAWQWSGGFGLPYVFAGFPPKFKSAQSEDFRTFFAPAESCATFCFFETKHHVQATLRALAESDFRNAQIFLAREMTKSHEELLSGTVSEMARVIEERLAKDDRFGELTVLLEGLRRPAGTRADADALLAFRSAPPKEAAKLLAQWTDLPVKDCYDRIVRERKDRP